MKLGVDCSNYTGNLSPAQVEALKAQGVQFAIVGTQKPDISQQQIEALEAGGIEVPAVYCFLYWDYGDEQRIHEAIVNFGKPVWLDCEYVADPMLTPAEVFTRIVDAMRVINESAGRLAGIYTGAWWWPKYTADVHSWAEIPLWHAAYQSQPESLVLPHPYGGWTKATIWQWSNGGLSGVNADLNVMEEAPVPAPPPQPSEVEALEALSSAAAIIANGNKNLADLGKEEDKEVLWKQAVAWVNEKVQGG